MRICHAAGAAVVIATVTACSGSPSPSPSPPSSATSSSPVETPSTSATSTEPPTTHSATVTSSPSSVPTAVAACGTQSLSLNARVTGAAAGTDYVSLVVTNIGDSPCRLFGYPGASFLDGQGNQLGLAAARDKSGTPHRVVLDPGDKAHAVLSFPNPGVFGSGCGQRQAKAVRMYPPDQTAALVDALTFSVCTNRQGRASVGPMRPGTRGF